ncbi:MAG: 2-oxoacid:acceptor oxidoreductase family protein [Wenzhouxiangellaceae bacterium]|nr:2-oxoacid:acceptor oxidoreductase family protein [Wenzhouxiangellaceae bacterium]
MQKGESKGSSPSRGIGQQSEPGAGGTANDRWGNESVPDGFFEIRFESIGGLGAHGAGKILATAAVLGLGLNGAHFSSYGSEKKGSVVRSFIRVGPSGKPIRTSAPVEVPDAVVVFHKALLQAPATFAGLKPNGILLYAAPPDEAVPPAIEKLPATVRVARVDAMQIALEEESRPNAVLLGALCKMVPFLDTEVVSDYLKREFAQKKPAAVKANERAFRRGAAGMAVVPNAGTATDGPPPARFEPAWGYDTAPIGGVLPRPGNSVWNDLSTARTGWLPVFDEETCIHCALCDLVCPDFCFVWQADRQTGVPHETRLTGIDYRYCKGCMRCIESCPTEALTRVVESPGLASRLRVPLFPQFLPPDSAKP